jgi:hypothetical protein
MSLVQLASGTAVPVVIIYDFEAAFGTPKPEDLAVIQAALERAGVVFIKGGVREEGQLTSG